MIDSKKLKNFTLHVMLSAAGEDVLAQYGYQERNINVTNIVYTFHKRVNIS
jgi:hypothetical protein